jgi:hypothetical protein
MDNEEIVLLLREIRDLLGVAIAVLPSLIGR